MSITRHVPRRALPRSTMPTPTPTSFLYLGSLNESPSPARPNTMTPKPSSAPSPNTAFDRTEVSTRPVTLARFVGCRTALLAAAATASTWRCRDLETRRKTRVSITDSGSGVPIRRDFHGCGDVAAGDQVPERFLCRPAARLAANGADRSHDGGDRESLQQAAGEV